MIGTGKMTVEQNQLNFRKIGSAGCGLDVGNENLRFKAGFQLATT